MSRQHLGEVVINLTVLTDKPWNQLAISLAVHLPRVFSIQRLCQAPSSSFLASSLLLPRPSVRSIWWTNFGPWASRSTGMIPAITKTAGSETVGYELVTQRDPLRCTADRRLFVGFFKSCVSLGFSPSFGPTAPVPSALEASS